MREFLRDFRDTSKDHPLEGAFVALALVILAIGVGIIVVALIVVTVTHVIALLALVAMVAFMATVYMWLKRADDDCDC